jgi:putative FmdB family regulatory protein
MPIYEYRCSACQREFEYQHKMSDPDPVRCEACGQDKLERLISWTSVRGTSWQGALLSGKNVKEALKGAGVVDRSRSQRFAGNEPASTEATGPADDDASAPAAAPADDTKSTGE